MLNITQVLGFPKLIGSIDLLQGGVSIARISSDVNISSNDVLANLTGLSVNVTVGRTYQFESVLFIKSGASVGGVQTAVKGTATATDVIYDGWCKDTGVTGTKQYTQVSSLGSAVSKITTVSDATTILIHGIITVNAGGTLTVQGAQNTSNMTNTVFGRGSYFKVIDSTPPT